MNARTTPLPTFRGPALLVVLLASHLVFSGSSSAAGLGPSASAPPVAEPTSEPARDATEEPAATPAPPIDSTTGSVRVNVGPAVDDANLLPAWIAKRNPGVERSLALPGHEQWIVVEIGGATYDYQVTVTPMRDGLPLGAAVAPKTCECNSQGLLELVDQQIATAVQQALSTPVPSEEPEPEPEPPEPEPEPEPTKKLRPLGIGGIVVAALGVGALAGGVAMVVLGERDVRDSQYPFFVRDYRPLGYATLTVGASALIAGATMLALDLTLCKRRPNAPGCPDAGIEQAGASFRRPRLSAILVPGTTGLSIHGRF